MSLAGSLCLPSISYRLLSSSRGRLMREVTATTIKKSKIKGENHLPGQSVSDAEMQGSWHFSFTSSQS